MDEPGVTKPPKGARQTGPATIDESCGVICMQAAPSHARGCPAIHDTICSKALALLGNDITAHGQATMLRAVSLDGGKSFGAPEKVGVIDTAMWGVAAGNVSLGGFDNILPLTSKPGASHGRYSHFHRPSDNLHGSASTWPHHPRRQAPCCSAVAATPRRRWCRRSARLTSAANRRQPAAPPTTSAFPRKPACPAVWTLRNQSHPPCTLFSSVVLPT